jgi:hypothetical protein|eukprot:SAG25_NODE_2420_length_1625_cov_1.626474_1_plen_248_part_00
MGGMGMGGMGMRGGMQGGMQGGQMLGPDGQPVKQTLLQRLSGMLMSGMEMMQMPMMMFSQVMMMFQQQAMTLMMAVMMLPEMLMMLPMVTQQLKQLMGKSDTDPVTGQTIPGVDYRPPPFATRAGRRIERRLLQLCTGVGVPGVGAAAEFVLKTAGLEPRALETLNQLDWAEIMRKAEAEREQQIAWDQQREQHAETQRQEKEEQAKMMAQQAQQGGMGMQQGGMGMRSGMGMGGMGMRSGGMYGRY